MNKIEIEVQLFEDDPYCPKCGRQKANNGLSYRVMVNHPDILMIECVRCGYEWFMECFPDK